MSDARKRAEEALAEAEQKAHRAQEAAEKTLFTNMVMPLQLEEAAWSRMALALRALLAEEPGAAKGVREAFVAGAAWHEFDETGATIWTSDRRRAEEEAERRYPAAEWIESPRLTAADAEVQRLTALLHECNAVCLCGCPESEHESYGEDGESCGEEGHECIRVAPAVLEIVNRYRVALSGALKPPPPADAAAEEGRVVVTATRRVGDKDTMSFDGTTFTTVRTCCDCGVLICGGPTRWLYCADKLHAQPVASDAATEAVREACDHEWGTDGQHSNVFCRRCYADKPGPDALRDAATEAVPLCESGDPLDYSADQIESALSRALHPEEADAAAKAAPLDHVAILTGLPVVLNGVLPEGSIFMHPRTFRGLPPERPSWLDRMQADPAPPLPGSATPPLLPEVREAAWALRAVALLSALAARRGA